MIHIGAHIKIVNNTVLCKKGLRLTHAPKKLWDGSKCQIGVSNTDTFGGFPLRCFIRAESGSSALAVAAMLASGLGKITLLDEL